MKNIIFPVLEGSYKKDKNFIDHETFLYYVGREKPWLLNGFFRNFKILSKKTISSFIKIIILYLRKTWI